MLRNIVALSVMAFLPTGLTSVPATALPAAVRPATALPATAQAAKIVWRPCPARDPLEGAGLKGLDCGRLQVPLDYARPGGPQITLALSRARHTDSRHYQGVVLLDRGGPGADGRDLPPTFARAKGGAAARVAARYDWIGFDPRGVGASTPALVCAADYQFPGTPKPDTFPATADQEGAWRLGAAAAAADCGDRYGDLLLHMGTADSARDLDAIRAALGVPRVSYFGYSYGTYLGAVYATMFPGRVSRMVLDSVVRPSGVWYADNLDQNVAFEKRIQDFFRWVARNQDVYHLGATVRAVRAAYAAARAGLAARPAGGRVGAVELDDTFLNDGYTDAVWAAHAGALSDYVRHGRTAGLLAQWQAPTALDINGYAAYLAVQCRDASWPRDWSVWHRDASALYARGNQFETWSNTWYNAPCAFWPVTGGPVPAVHGGRPGSGRKGPRILLVQATRDAATPYRGAVETHRRFPSSRLLVESGGGDHGVTLGGDRCVDGHVWAFFRDGTLPRSRPGPDATCRAGRDPRAVHVPHRVGHT